jgi:hypothetical protein
VRCSWSRRVRTPYNRSLSDAIPETSDGGPRRLRRRNPIKQRAHNSVPRWHALARTPFRICNEYISKTASRYQRARQLALLCQPRSRVFNKARPESRHFASRPNHGALLLSAWTHLQRAAYASSVTSSMSTTTPCFVSRRVTSSNYHHPVSSPLTFSLLLVLISISRINRCGVHSSRRDVDISDA